MATYMESRSNRPSPAVSLGVRAAVFTSLSILVAVLLSALILEIEGRSEARGAANEQLRRARFVAAGRLARDGEQLRRLAATVARDPKFFALLALRRSERTATFRQSLEGVIREFQADAKVEIFDITDEWGATAAASERPAAPEASRGNSPLVRRALAGTPSLGFRLEGGRLYRVAVVPVLAGGQAPVGTLTLGSPLDESFADAVRSATGADLLLLAGEITAAGAERSAARPIVTTLSDAAARSVMETIGAPAGADAKARPGEGRPVSLAKMPALASDVALDGAIEGGAARLLLIAPLALEAGLAPLRQTLLAAGAMAAGAALFAGFVAGSGLSRRLRRLGAAARAAGDGNYEAPLPAPDGDEVGILTADFQAMREKQRRDLDHLVEVDRMKSDFLTVTAQDLMSPVQDIRRAGEIMAAKNAPALGVDGMRRLRVIRGGADTLSRMVHDLGGASVVFTRTAEPAPPDPDAEDEEEASLHVVSAAADFRPAVMPDAPSGAEGAPGVADAPSEPAPPREMAPVDVAALVELAAVEMIVEAAERGIEVEMAIDPDLLHPAAEATTLAASMRDYGRNAIATLQPGSVLSFAAWRTARAIEVRLEGGPLPLEITLSLDTASPDPPDLSNAG